MRVSKEVDELVQRGMVHTLLANGLLSTIVGYLSSKTNKKTKFWFQESDKFHQKAFI